VNLEFRVCGVGLKFYIINFRISWHLCCVAHLYYKSLLDIQSFTLMNKTNINGIWKGFYELGESYGPNLAGRRTNFVMNLVEADGLIEGECNDMVKESNASRAEIKGFIENEMISFIKQYPVHIFIKQDGERIIDENSNHPIIEYTGYYDNETNKYAGTWEMVTKTIMMNITGEKEIGEYYSSGEWEMSR
jgi:hypothetical protein